MQIIRTEQTTELPEDIKLACSAIQEKKDLSVLTAEERKEYEGFGNANRKNEFLTGRMLLRYLLLKMDISPDVVSLKKEKGGKPYLLIENKRAYVSFSHSKEMVWCALSLVYDIGVDAERIDRSIRPAMLNRILSPNEKSNCIAEELEPIQIWTIKEAAVKKMGTGLRTNLYQLEIETAGEGSLQIKINDDNSFQICSFRQLDHQISLAY